MSIKRMSAVWDDSQHAGNDLLQLLALADMANDDGYCWPGIDHLRKKTRLSESTVIRRNAALEKSGELIIDHNRRHGNRYLVVTGFTEERKAELVAQYFGPDFNTVKLTDNHNYQDDSSQLSDNDSSELADHDSSQLSPVTDDPSRTANEPPKETPLSPADADEGRDQPASDPESEEPPADAPPWEAPHRLNVDQVKALKLTRKQWEALLNNERKGLSRYGVRSTVIEHVEQKLARPPMEPLLDAMLQAVDAATVQSIDDPGIYPQMVKYIRGTLWAGKRPYTPAEVQRFAEQQGPVESLYHLAGALSKWRNPSPKRGKGKGKGNSQNGKVYVKPKSGGQPADATPAAYVPNR